MLRTLVSALLLLTLPLAQARAIVVCAMAPQAMPEACTCPHDRQGQRDSSGAATSDHSRAHAAGHGDCCALEFVPADERMAVADAKGALRPPPVDEPTDDPTGDVAARPFEIAPPSAHAAPVRFSSSPLVRDDSRLYLLTERLRL